MKKIIAFFVIVILSTAANIQVFSQKLRTVALKKVPVVKSEDAPNVKLQSAGAFSEGKGVYLRWQAEYETQNLGFYVYRSTARGTELAGPEIVGGGSLKSSEEFVRGENYSFFDPNGDLSTVYYLESVGLNGKRQTFEPLVPAPVKNIAAVAGFTLPVLIKRKETAALEKISLNLPKDLQTEVDLNALPPDINTQRWVAAQPGVKIGVKQEGIYRVTRAELQTAGFDVNTPGNLWQLYVDGKEQAIVLGENDSYIEFYGTGTDTPENDTKVYYLIAGSQFGQRMNTTVLRTLGGNVTTNSYYQSFVRKERKLYISSDILNGDAENFFGNQPIVGSSSPTPATTAVTFNLTGVDFTSPTVKIELGLQGITATPHQFVVRLNGQQLGPMTGSGKVLMNGVFQIPTSVLLEGANTLQLQSFAGAGDVSVVESLKISYYREFKAVQNKLSFYTNNYRATTVTGFTSPNIRVFDLTFPDRPTILTNLRITDNGGSFSVTLPSHRGRVAFAAENTAVLTAASIVPNTPSTLSTAAHNGELLIVAYKDFMTQANDWANYRRAQGMTVEVVNVDDIFDEFSYGSVATAGITQFFQFAKNNWQTAPNYILLIGDTSYDFRNYEGRPFQNFVPTKLVDTIYEETGSDEALCDFNNDGLAEIAVGRIPARNAAGVTQALNKTMAFESTLATAYGRGALFASDEPNGYNFEALSQRLANELPPSIPKTYINRAQADSRNLLLANMNQGRYLVNYSGHGSTGIWDGNWFTMPDALALNNAPNYSLFFMLTCLNGYYIRADADSLGEALLRAPNGGAVAAWASTGKTTPDVQEVMAKRFYNQLNVGNMTKIGDLIKDAKTNVVGGRDVRLSWALLGDPTLRIKP